MENYSYYQCPDCGKQVEIFGKSHLDALAQEYGLPILARLPIDPGVAALVDEGRVEEAVLPEIAPAAEALAAL